MKTYLGAFAELDETDYSILEKFISEFATYFGYSADGILKHEFIKLFPPVGFDHMAGFTPIEGGDEV